MKLFYFDVETTGLDPKLHDIVQLSYIIEIDNLSISQRNLFLRPMHPENANPEALKVNGLTLETISKFPDPVIAYSTLVGDLDRYIDKYDKADKLWPVAFCGHFDFGFLTDLALRMGDKFLGSYINHRRLLDPAALARFLSYFGMIDVEDHKLLTLANHFGIPIQAHDALSDTRAMRDLFHILTDRYKLCITAELGTLKPEEKVFPEQSKSRRDLDVVLDNFNKQFNKGF